MYQPISCLIVKRVLGDFNNKLILAYLNTLFFLKNKIFIGAKIQMLLTIYSLIPLNKPHPCSPLEQRTTLMSQPSTSSWKSLKLNSEMNSSFVGLKRCISIFKMDTNSSVLSMASTLLKPTLKMKKRPLSFCDKIFFRSHNLYGFRLFSGRRTDPQSMFPSFAWKAQYLQQKN